MHNYFSLEDMSRGGAFLFNSIIFLFKIHQFYLLLIKSTPIILDQILSFSKVISDLNLIVFMGKITLIIRKHGMSDSIFKPQDNFFLASHREGL